MHINQTKQFILFVKTLTARKVYNSLILRISYFVSRLTKRYVHWGNAESLSVEPTNLCNLKCPECPSGNNKMTRARLFLSENDFKAIIDKTYPWLMNLQLFFQGEPFMHPKIYAFISYATGKNIYTSTSTNGHFLTNEACTKIIESGLKQIIISIDGTTQDTYEQYRVGGSLEKALNGIETLLLAKKKHNALHPFVIIQFVVFKTNEHQIEDIKKLAKKLKVDQLSIKSAQIEDYKNGNNLIPLNPKYSRYIQTEENTYKLNRKSNFKCKRIWNANVITAENKVVPCCFDKNADYSYGNYQALNQSVWRLPIAKSFIQSVWKKPSTYSMCENCTEGIKKSRR